MYSPRVGVVIKISNRKLMVRMQLCITIRAAFCPVPNHTIGVVQQSWKSDRSARTSDADTVVKVGIVLCCPKTLQTDRLILAGRIVGLPCITM